MPRPGCIALRTFADVTELRWPDVSADQLPTPSLRETARELDARGIPWRLCRAGRENAPNALSVLYAPSLRRAGVVLYNAEPVWLDANGWEDALRRYFAQQV